MNNAPLKMLLEYIDEWLFSFLEKNQLLLPLRWRKFVAAYYPDARIRKIYWETLDVCMGENTFANLGFLVIKNSGETSKIIIGNNVSIATNVTIVTDSAPNNSKVLRNISYVKEKLIREEPVIIEDDVWVGAGVIILPGVRIGRGAIIGAGSLVKDDVPSFTIVAGVPARIIKQL